MKNFVVAVLGVIFLIPSVLFSRDLYDHERKIYQKNNKSRKYQPRTGCAPAVSTAILEVNNVRTIIEGTGGNMWQDRANGLPFYNVPKPQSSSDVRRSCIYAGGLWMGGTDVNGQLKLAAVLFRSLGKNDFWPGPLDKTTADVTADVCSKFDKHFKITKKQVSDLRLYNLTINDPKKSLKDVGLLGYTIPQEILDYPGNSGLPNTFSSTLAPFFDANGDGGYDPNDGDYPYYEFDNKVACGTSRDPRLYGDETIWFVFNDKGNAHTETNAPSIGMEIHGQAFGFATDDEVNDMTFYNYQLTNVSTFTLVNTFFAQYVDSDLGFPDDDYVGSDVSRGLAYCFNGDDDDNVSGSNTSPGYGQNPPAIGVDFFQGPYVDNDNRDNPLVTNIQVAIDSGGIPYSGLGIGYGDGIIDNERYGMKKFLYFNRPGTGSGWNQDPTLPAHFYGYMIGRWRDGSTLVWGGQGHSASSSSSVPCDFLFPGDSDPLNWSSRGVPVTPVPWSETTEKNGVGDRRLLQSAGPFTLKPGAVNDLTVGVVYARANSGGPFASVLKLLTADDKAQLLFDNCFRIVEGPDAPIITAQELDKEIILYLDNPRLSNNYNEEYKEIKPDILIPDTIGGVFIDKKRKQELKSYQFQGYQVYQAVDGTVTPREIGDLERVRLVDQCDIEDTVTSIINYEIVEVAGKKVRMPVAKLETAQNTGIRHSFRITRDAFTKTANPLLVNYKTYYFFIVAYGFNEFKKYNPINPLSLDGQKEPYIRSRKRGDGQSITTLAVIPHDPKSEREGTIVNSEYGFTPEITRIEGIGNGGNELELTEETEKAILQTGYQEFLKYKKGKGPVNIRVIDPLNVKPGTYYLKFVSNNPDSLELSNWVLYDKNNITDTIAKSKRPISEVNEQLLLDYGISINIKQPRRQFGKAFDSTLVASRSYKNGFISASISFKDKSKRWLRGLSDQEGVTQANWILSGSVQLTPPPIHNEWYSDRRIGLGGGRFLDPDSDFEKMIEGTWSIMPFVGEAFPPNSSTDVTYTGDRPGLQRSYSRYSSKIIQPSNYANDYIHSVDLVITSDKSKWSRSVVLESNINSNLTENKAEHLKLRKSSSVNKEGNPDNSQTQGLGWFPGYAIDLETGERLNIAFSEDSFLADENGRDMVWNPTSVVTKGIANEIRWGGKHFVYIFRNDGGARTNRYDACAKIHSLLSNRISSVQHSFLMSEVMYVGIPLLQEGSELLETDVRISFRVDRRYGVFKTSSNINNGYPLYEINLNSVATQYNAESSRQNSLDKINIVPNPYRAFSSYERTRLDNRVKVINVPENCEVSIYSSNGTLVRYFNKSDANTYIDWDLRNESNVLVASGVYYIHINGKDFGEKTLKLVAVMKPIDITSF